MRTIIESVLNKSREEWASDVIASPRDLNFHLLITVQSVKALPDDISTFFMAS